MVSADNHKLTKTIAMVGSVTPANTGTCVMLQQLLDDNVDDRYAKVIVVNTGGIRGKGLNGLARFFRVLIDLIRATLNSDVVALHLSSTAFLLFAPIVLPVTAILRRPLVIRMYGGEGYFYHSRLGQAVARWIINRAASYMLESKMLVAASRSEGVYAAEWFPNNRPIRTDLQTSERGSCNRFVFMSGVIFKLCRADIERF